MEFKKVVITNFVKKTLEVYIIELEFKNDLGKIKISQLEQLSQELVSGNFYDMEPELLLLPKPGVSFQLGLGPLTFNNSINNNQLQVGSNFLKIIIKKYENWGIQYDEIKNIFQILTPLLEDIIIKGFQIVCINSFDNIEKEEKFGLDKIFTHSVSSSLTLNYDDFHLGMVPHLVKNEDRIEKIVLKLRGVPPKVSNFFLFKLESLFIKRNIDVMISDPKLLSSINYGHDFLNLLFVTSLTKNYCNKIGLTFEPLEED